MNGLDFTNKSVLQFVGSRKVRTVRTMWQIISLKDDDLMIYYESSIHVNIFVRDFEI